MHAIAVTGYQPRDQADISTLSSHLLSLQQRMPPCLSCNASFPSFPADCGQSSLESRAFHLPFVSSEGSCHGYPLLLFTTCPVSSLILWLVHLPDYLYLFLVSSSFVRMYGIYSLPLWLFFCPGFFYSLPSHAFLDPTFLHIWPWPVSQCMIKDDTLCLASAPCYG